MANRIQLDLLKQGKDYFSQWRKMHPNIQIDLSGEDLSKRNLSQIDLSGADFSGTNLYNTNLREANLRGACFHNAYLYGAELTKADLTEADFTEADLSWARVSGARFHKACLYNVNLSHSYLSATELFDADFSSGVNLSGADLSKAVLNAVSLRKADLSDANLSQADLDGADLSEANLIGATLVDTNLRGAILTNCRIYGIAAWGVNLQGAQQENLVITRDDEPTITVDYLNVAQFIYTLLNNKNTRDALDTITQKVVLILGSFTDERKMILDALKQALRDQNYVPMLFDFDRPINRNLTETITTLARLSRFIIADLTDPRSIPQELSFIVPDLPSVPVKPLILNSQYEYGMFEHFTRFPWVLPVYQYLDQASLLHSLKENVIDPAEQKAQELAMH
jgi:uncharacterized protein YjbI with pentapeptide repeats